MIHWCGSQAGEPEAHPQRATDTGSAPDGCGVNFDNRVRHRDGRGRRLQGDPLLRRHRSFHRVGADQHHRSRAQHQGLVSSAGSSTVEAALGVATLVAVLVLCLAGVTAVSMQVRCLDAAREAARQAARGDERAGVAAARRIAPGGAQVHVHRDGDFLVATVVAHSKLLPTLDIAARAVSAAEPSG
ncbi:MAG: hypothetical protein QOH91_2612 [Mycobacterium sp.]|nr:hypothetical protein [Mycobacterium sp.]